MKIAFLCTSLAPGRDGVGDYVRQLAAACTLAGHECLLIAVHDRHLAPPATLLQRGNELRWSANVSWSRRARMLADRLREFDPHWISWQIVPYGFHPKGIIPRAAFQLVAAAKPWPNQVMLHELWIGLADSDPLRARVIGVLQRRQLLAFLRQVSPACIHTTNTAYQLALAYHGWPSELLPLFGNMPVLPVTRADAEAELLALAGPFLPEPPRWTAVIFGTLHPQWNPDPTLAWLQQAAADGARPIGLVALGRIGPHGTRLLTELAARQTALRICHLGPQPPERISHLLQACDFGLATHPWGLIEKSGSTATLLEHGLPVLVPRDDWHPRHGTAGSPRDPLLRRLDDLQPAGLARWLTERRAPAPRLPAIASRFIAQLRTPLSPGALVA
jgi:hypothetical protein